MATGEWNREDLGQADSRGVAEVNEPIDIITAAELINPLAEIAADLALCLMALEEGLGAFCDDCVCQLKYHIGPGDCELCLCYEQHTRAYRPLTSIPHIEVIMNEEREPPIGYDLDWNRSQQARLALRELTE